MANPTFNGTALATEAAHTRVGSRRTRAYTETMPGVNGAFVQTHGYGSREIDVDGLLTGSGSTADLARSAVMTAFRQREQLADGSTVATVFGTDGCAYASCLLQRYTHGRLRVAQLGTASFVAYLPIHAALVQLTP